ncbi:cell division protein DedD [Acerihabitans sp. KWT182]|uniref:Cell division protein DedD n=1 Tax=Acerihabitans sp. KWT182 TaxID=3157919 RepID=A0AAU7Q7F5_9GAMM
MASKFQNRLVGTIIIVALGVIVLPGLLDGKKKHYQDEFAAIPLVPKPGDTDETEVSPQANQALPSQPPEGAGAAVEQANTAPAGEAQPAASVPDNAEQPAIAAAKPNPAAPRQQPVKTAPRPATAKPAARAENKPAASAEETAPRPTAATPKPAATQQQAAEQAPKGQAWVVQLGALKNAAKVTEIVAKLRLSGYRVYTVPSQPVAGQITRIFVGPDASKEKLQGALAELNQLSGLNGQLRAYQVR